MSEASQTANDAKSTVVMEFSTVQKIVQIVDNNDCDINPVRPSFKDTVVQRDTADKRYNYNAKRNSATDVPTAENS